MDGNDPPRRAPRQRVAREAENLLRADLDGGRWPPGTQLPSEGALAAELGVGRSSAREAIQALARDGHLVVRHGIGTFACARTEHDSSRRSIADLVRRARIIEVYQVRRGLEVEAARLAAARADANPDDLHDLEQILRRRQNLLGHATADFVEADLEFHRAVIALAGNALLRDLFDQFTDALRTAITDLVDHEPTLPDTSKDHADLLDALRGGDAAAAAEATVKHFEVVIDLLRRD